MRVLSFFALIATAALTANAQTNAPEAVRQISLEDCIQMVLRQNVDIQIERSNPQIARFNLRSSYGAYDPTLAFSAERGHSEAGPTLLGTNFISGTVSDGNSVSSSLDGLLPWGMLYSLRGDANDTDRKTGLGLPIANSSGGVSAGVTQPLLRNFWIDSTRLTIRFNKNLLTRSEWELKRTIMERITLLEQAYYDLIFHRENVLVQQKAVELAEQLVTENRKRVEVGAMAPLEAKFADSQAAASRADLIAAKSNLAVQENIVKQLITANYAEWAGVSLVPSGGLTAPAQVFSLQDSWRKGLSQRPEMVQAKLDAERAGIQLKFDRNQLFPQLDLFATYGYNGSGAEFSGTFYDIEQRNRPFYNYGAQISIPLANIGPRNNYKASKVSLQQAVMVVKRWERDIMRAIDDDIKVAQASFERVAATRAAREYTEEALAAEQKKLEQGKSTTYTVLQIQRDLTQARGQEIQALDQYKKNLSQLSFDEGAT
ncbi:MAG: TolC family protein, partial [Akkermansiaceae bacterium]|nr:TolC family protein [Verrucomicrobiales bacterium]